MRILAMVVVKNEVDIIDEYLQTTVNWADKVFILDNGSTDGTWERLQAYNGDKVVVWKRDERPFSNSLRGELFRKFRKEANEGDWWCVRADVDEFYLEDPREFLMRVPRIYNQVDKKSVEYCLTIEDFEENNFVGNFLIDKDKIKYIKPYLWCERRFVREHKGLSWPEGSPEPSIKGLTYPKNILCAHYQSRSPQQLKKRVEERQKARSKSPEKVFAHVPSEDWKDALWNREQAMLDCGMKTWSSLPLKNKRSIIDNVKKRLKRFYNLK